MTILWSFSYNSFVKFHNFEKLWSDNLLYPNLCYNEVCYKGTALDMLYSMNVMNPIFIVNYKFHAILYMPFLLISFLFFFSFMKLTCSKMFVYIHSYCNKHLFSSVITVLFLLKPMGESSKFPKS